MMVTGEPLVLVMSIQSSLELGWVRTPDTSLHISSLGPEGVAVGVNVCVGVNVVVGVRVMVGVFEGVAVREGVTVGVRVLVLVGVTVRVRVCVGSRVRVAVGGPGDGVQEGMTKLVNVGKSVGEGLTVAVWVGGEVGVNVISACNCPWASAGETGVIWLCEQY